MKHAVLAVLLVLTLSCSKKELIRPSADSLAFRSFVFLRTAAETFRASGDLVLYRSSLFKMRVYDNLLNRRLFDFTASADGVNRAVFPDRKIVYTRTDETFSRVLTEYVFLLFDSNVTAPPEYDKITGFLLENNRIKYIMFIYYDQSIRIEVLKRFEDGMPRRIRIQKENEDLLFDIVSFTQDDFTVEDEGFRTIERQSGTIFDWAAMLKNG
jgi:hypothetical protein